MNDGDLLPVVGYERISADTARDAHGVDDQGKVNHATAARLSWKIVYSFRDNDKSAAKANVVREDFERMLKIVKAGKLPDGTPVRGVVVVADDRLVRRPGDYERFVEALTFQDGRVYADAKGSKDLYSEDVESMGLFGAVISKMEVRKMQRRMRRSHRARAELGVPVGGNRPFGWDANRIDLLEPEASLLAAAAHAFVRGRSLHTIVTTWTAQGVKTSRGNDWTMRSLKLTLWNPRICGWRRIGEEIIKDAAGVPVVGLWKPIVTPEVWRAIDAIFQRRRGKKLHRNGTIIGDLPVDFREPKYLLTGILRCGKPVGADEICGSTLRVSHSPDCVQHIYQCGAKSTGGCGGVARRGDLVDAYITEAVLAKIEERTAIRVAAEPWTGQTELDRIHSKRARLKAEWEADEVSDDLFFSSVKSLEARIKDLTSERSGHELLSQRAIIEVDGIRDRWVNDMDLMQQRALIADALHAVIVLPAGKGRKPFNPGLLVPRWRQ
jgi:DNA invertase Pin-like site-specific DNA recombinase